MTKCVRDRGAPATDPAFAKSRKGRAHRCDRNAVAEKRNDGTDNLDPVAAAFVKLESAKRSQYGFTAAKVFLAEALKLSRDLARIGQQQRELETRISMHDEQHDEWLQSTYRNTMLPYSKDWNIDFAGKMQSHLPREIRDMIYQCLINDPDFEDSYGRALRRILNAGIVLDDPFELNFLPHYLSSDFMGRITANEFAERFYSTPWVQSQLLCPKTSDLAYSIRGDPFHVGFSPASVLREVRVLCKVDTYRHRQAQYERPRSRTEGCACREHLEKDQLEHHFECLLDIVHKEKFELTVKFHQRNVRLNVLEAALDAFATVYQAFSEAGADIHILWSYFARGPSSFTHALTREVTEFFTTPRHLWKQDMLEFLHGNEDSLLSRHIRFKDEPDPDLSDAEFRSRVWGIDENADTTDGSSAETDVDSEDDTDSSADDDW